MNRFFCIISTFSLSVALSPGFADDPEPDLSPAISVKGKLLFHDGFDGPQIKAEWVGLHGTQWQLVDGTLKGKPSPEAYQKKQIARGNAAHSGKTPSTRLMVQTDDCIILFRFKLAEGLVGAHFGFNDGTVKTGTGHVGRFIATRKTGLALQKDRNATIEGDKDETLKTDDFNLKPDTWYWMMLEVIGEEMVAQISGSPLLKAKHSRLDIPKDQINLPTRGGGVIFYDHVHVWNALPAK